MGCDARGGKKTMKKSPARGAAGRKGGRFGGGPWRMGGTKQAFSASRSKLRLLRRRQRADPAGIDYEIGYMGRQSLASANRRRSRT